MRAQSRALGGAIVSAIVVTLVGCGSNDNDGGTASAPAPVAQSPREACDALANKTVGGATIGATALVAATATAPEYCKVSARIDPKLNFEVRLPSNWNNKLHHGGGGGFNGRIPAADTNALSKGFAQVSSDSGHTGNPAATPLGSAVFDASWALNDPEAVIDFGHRSTPTVMAATREIVRQRYGHNASRSYFEGCSNGGREALMNAQRYPDLFDGIIARAPAYNWIGLLAADNRHAKALAAPGGALTPAKLTTLSNAVLAACDAQDGVADGIVSNLPACNFNPSTLRCSNGADTGASCLSDAQLAVVSSWTGDLALSTGQSNTRWPLTGNESDPGAWPTWVTGDTAATPPVPSYQFVFQDQFIRFMVVKDPVASSLAFSPEANLAALQNMSAVLDSTDSNLSRFRARNGKLILWHGTNDSAISVNGTTRYYTQATNAAGGQAAADEFMRYYIAPGVNHCSGGPGADQTDLLAALDSWVTANAAPGDLAATKVNAQTGATTLARPLCVYPRYPRYNGSGDVNAASSYTCTAP